MQNVDTIGIIAIHILGFFIAYLYEEQKQGRRVLASRGLIVTYFFMCLLIVMKLV